MRRHIHVQTCAHRHTQCTCTHATCTHTHHMQTWRTHYTCVCVHTVCTDMYSTDVMHILPACAHTHTRITHTSHRCDTPTHIHTTRTCTHHRDVTCVGTWTWAPRARAWLCQVPRLHWWEASSPPLCLFMTGKMPMAGRLAPWGEVLCRTLPPCPFNPAVPLTAVGCGRNSSRILQQ